jgi:hypothetical protein
MSNLLNIGKTIVVTNNGLGWKWQAETNAPAYYTSVFITIVKKFIVQGPGEAPHFVKHQSNEFGMLLNFKNLNSGNKI